VRGRKEIRAQDEVSKSELLAEEETTTVLGYLCLKLGEPLRPSLDEESGKVHVSIFVVRVHRHKEFGCRCGESCRIVKKRVDLESDIRVGKPRIERLTCWTSKRFSKIPANTRSLAQSRSTRKL